LLKFLHTLGGVGLLGAMISLLILLAIMPAPVDAPLRYLQQREAMDAIAQWLLLPSLGLTLVSGLLSMAAVPGFHNAGWAWLKLATGVLMFEGTLLAVQGPIEAAAREARKAVAAGADLSALGTTLAAEQNSLWVLAAVAVVNVLLGVWRPVFSRWRLFRFSPE
jgi:hypothetical protein